MLGMNKNGGSDWRVGVAPYYRVNDQSWEEETVTWNNAPAHDNTLVASLGAVTNGNWYSVDLTSLVSADGTYSLRVTSTSSDGADYRSKEGVNPPVLEVEVAGDPTPTLGDTETPTPTVTETPTYTPTPTPTEIPTELALVPEAELSLLSGGVETLEAAYYWYDGDGRDLCTPEPRSGERGNMVKSEINGIVTYDVGKHYEKQVDGVAETLRKYYTAGTNRLAMRAPQGRSAKTAHLPDICLMLHLDSTRPRTTRGTQPISRMSRRGSAIHKNSPINGLSTNPFPYIMV